MPTISVFIRKADVDKWRSIENKSEWLHYHLNSGEHTLAAHGKKVELEVTGLPDLLKDVQPTEAIRDLSFDDNPDWGA